MSSHRVHILSDPEKKFGLAIDFIVLREVLTEAGTKVRKQRRRRPGR